MNPPIPSPSPPQAIINDWFSVSVLVPCLPALLVAFWGVTWLFIGSLRCFSNHLLVLLRPIDMYCIWTNSTCKVTHLSNLYSFSLRFKVSHYAARYPDVLSLRQLMRLSKSGTYRSGDKWELIGLFRDLDLYAIVDRNILSPLVTSEPKVHLKDAWQ